MFLKGRVCQARGEGEMKAIRKEGNVRKGLLERKEGCGPNQLRTYRKRRFLTGEQRLL